MGGVLLIEGDVFCSHPTIIYIFGTLGLGTIIEFIYKRLIIKNFMFLDSCLYGLPNSCGKSDIRRSRFLISWYLLQGVRLALDIDNFAIKAHIKITDLKRKIIIRSKIEILIMITYEEDHPYAEKTYSITNLFRR